MFLSLRPVSTQTFGSLCIEHQWDWKGSLPPSSLPASLTTTLWYPGGYNGDRSSGTEKQWTSPVWISGFCGSLHQFWSFKLCKECPGRRRTCERKSYIYTHLDKAHLMPFTAMLSFKGMFMRTAGMSNTLLLYCQTVFLILQGCSRSEIPVPGSTLLGMSWSWVFPFPGKGACFWNKTGKLGFTDKLRNNSGKKS